MPFINLNGKLTEVTQEEYDIYTVGQNRSQVSGTPQTPAEAAAAVAAGGSVTNSNTATTPILTPNTTNTSPDQTLTTTNVQAAVKATLDADTGQAGDNVSATDTKTGGDTVLNPDYNAGLAGTTQTVPAGDVKYTPEQLDALAAANGVDAGDERVPASSVNTSAKPVAPAQAGFGAAYDEEGNLNPGYTLDENNNPVFVGGSFVEPATQAQANADRAKATKANAKAQQTINQQRKQINSADWRVRLRLAPNSKYLYNANDPGILAPLSAKSGTDGVIFPYTPAIDTTYRAQYSNYDLTHSNYRGYFYGNSYTDVINIRAMFTAQDTREAEYLLAVIHFFRSVTKMFYGQDAQRGSPPPLVYLSGLGEYQFNEHSCLVSAFQYNLPSDVNYIRARSSNVVGGLNLTTQRGKQSVSTPGNFAGLNRLAAALLPVGGLKKPPSPPTLGLNNPTYVPTKIEISLSLLPVQSRQQVSNQFSVKDFASGNLLKGGFW